MGRFRVGSTRRIDGNLYARVRYKDENGKLKEKLKKASSVSHAKKPIREMLDELNAPKQVEQTERKID